MRLQISLQLAPNPTIGTFFTNLRPVILPVFWFDAEAAITEDIADQLKLIGGLFMNLESMCISFLLQI